MPALADDIAAGTRPAVIVKWTQSAIKDLYPSARDGEADPSEGFFDDADDAQAAINQRGALIGQHRRRFLVTVPGLLWLDASAGIPAATLIDDELAAIGTFMIARCEVDLEADITTLELFG